MAHVKLNEDEGGVVTQTQCEQYTTEYGQKQQDDDEVILFVETKYCTVCHIE